MLGEDVRPHGRSSSAFVNVSRKTFSSASSSPGGRAGTPGVAGAGLANGCSAIAFGERGERVVLLLRHRGIAARRPGRGRSTCARASFGDERAGRDRVVRRLRPRRRVHVVQIVDVELGPVRRRAARGLRRARSRATIMCVCRHCEWYLLERVLARRIGRLMRGVDQRGRHVEHRADELRRALVLLDELRVDRRRRHRLVLQAVLEHRDPARSSRRCTPPASAP